jgi:hypothetical protein
MRMTYAARGAAASARIGKVSFAYRGRVGAVGEVVLGVVQEEVRSAYPILLIA